MASIAPPLPLGSRAGRLESISPPYTRGKYKYVKVRCDCGTEKDIEQSSFRSGRVNSCGCLNREVASVRFTTHGKRKDPIYAVWNSMIQRCHSPDNSQYPDYGGRGITVCQEWRTFENFYKDVGDPPFKGAMLERANNDLGYNPANITWATRAEQNNNTRRTVKFLYNGSMLTLGQIAELAGIKLNTLRTRVYTYGMTAQEAADTPVMTGQESGALAGKPTFTREGQRLDGVKVNLPGQPTAVKQQYKIDTNIPLPKETA